jgi:hypothetical protein
MTLQSIKQLVDAELNGQSWWAGWHKVPSQATATNFWYDLTYAAGNPPPNYYIGAQNTYTPNSYTLNFGLPIGPNVAPLTKYLKNFTILSASNNPIIGILCDYVGFYPFLDESNPGYTATVQGGIYPTRNLNTNTATLGPELAVQIGASGTTGFTAVQNCTLSNGGGSIIMTATAANPYAAQYITGVTPGQMYRLEWVFSSVASAAGAGQLYVGSVTGGFKIDLGQAQYVSGTSSAFYGFTRSLSFIASSTTVNVNWGLGASAVNGDTLTMTSISLKAVNNRLPQNKNQGLQLLPIVTNSHSGNPTYYVQYTNQDGLPNRWTGLVTASSTQTVSGGIFNNPAQGSTASNPFLTLQTGDTGVRSCDGIMMVTTDIGLFCMALVWPIENFIFRSNDSPCERVPVTDFPDMPIIQDDAAIGMLILNTTNIAGIRLMGYMQTVWG